MNDFRKGYINGFIAGGSALFIFFAVYVLVYDYQDRQQVKSLQEVSEQVGGEPEKIIYEFVTTQEMIDNQKTLEERVAMLEADPLGDYTNNWLKYLYDDVKKLKEDRNKYVNRANEWSEDIETRVLALEGWQESWINMYEEFVK